MLQEHQQMLWDFQSVSDHFGTLCIKGLNKYNLITPVTSEMQFSFFQEDPEQLANLPEI